MTDGDAVPVVTSRGRHPARLSLRPHGEKYEVELVSDGLEVRCPIHRLSADDGLTAFVEDLAGRFRGWDGVRTWRSSEDQLTIAAGWLDGGHVTLDVRVRRGVTSGWEVRVVFTVDAGEQMRTLASDLADFFGTG